MQIPMDELFAIQKKGNIHSVFNKGGEVIATVQVLFGHKWVVRNMFGLRLGTASKSRWISYEINKLVENGRLTLTKPEQVKQMIEHHEARIDNLKFSIGQTEQEIVRAKEAIQMYKAGEVE